MSAEPVSGSAGGYALWKLAVALGIPASLVAVVVMLWVQPKSSREWGMALTTTVCSSLFGGAAVVRYFGWQMWVDDTMGLAAIGGIMFACGLPAWALVRAMFAFFDSSRGQDIVALVKALKEAK